MLGEEMLRTKHLMFKNNRSHQTLKEKNIVWLVEIIVNLNPP
jgi:hypothetical protein